MEVIICLLGIIVGFVFGFVLQNVRIGKPMGRILMHRADDPDEAPYLMVELYDVPEALYGHRQVLFDIAQK